MIKINLELVKSLEELAKLQLEAQEREDMLEDMREILGYMEMLNEVDVTEVEPMYTPIEEAVFLREDVNQSFDSVENIRQSFPKEMNGHILVPGIHA
ncbi:MAG: Asp-tRNA(Asn)/Glu-tRNA(Gln) amidotransferase subunit GatC [Thermotogaceae bacterium]|nr:Asp-tRNA(Asn)/Glu-tRNA(Gln) amidotransferase subunit GatC [Thermotogaceae bacterium]